MNRIDQITAVVVDEAIQIHRKLGPGLYENVYEAILVGRLAKAGFHVARQVPVAATMKEGIRHLVNNYSPE